jgi:hydroxyacylglutathione hydrolase
MLSGDFIFAGDVGRPDLLERAAGHSGTMAAAARALFGSLQRTKVLPDYLQIWPGHGAGSACGKALGSIPQSTLGYERLANWAFSIHNEDDFVQEALAGQTTPPRYFATMKRVNRAGPSILGGIRPPERIDAEALQRLLTPGAGVVIDTRSAAAFASEHLLGAISIPFNKSFTKWAGSILNPEANFALLVEEEGQDVAARIGRDLLMIGFDRLIGFATTREMAQSRAQGTAAESSNRVDAEQAEAMIDSGAVTVLDVRDPHELLVGHIPDATLFPLSALPGREQELPLAQPLLVYCEGGTRSAIAASVLRAAGAAEVYNLKGGFTAWARAGKEVVRGDVETAHS